MSKTFSITETKRVVKPTAEDLTKLNGLPIKVNTEYIMNLNQLLLFSLCETFSTGVDKATTEIPLLGSLTVEIERLENGEPKFNYSFEPNDYFKYKLEECYHKGTIDLPDLLMDKYSDKILTIYDEIVGES